MSEFSARTRARSLARMRASTFDLLVVGGGIVGAGIARDAARRGLATALLERGDFASGTSGKTSRLIHGGLRYLRAGRFRLVRLAVRERDRLLRNAPALVHPLPFVLPAYAGRGPGRALLGFGLILYDFLSKDKALPRRAWISPDEVRHREPRLATDGLRGAGVYYDAWVDDARLVLAVVRDASEAGAAVANHVEVEGLRRESGRVTGAAARDRIGGDTLDVRARVVVNATGVWLDRLRAPRPRPTIRPTKGIHILLPREKVGNRHAIAWTARDGRVVFVIPWRDLALVGTTDTDFRGDVDRPLPDATDIAYLLESVNEAFPQAGVRPEEVVSAYAGLRPLLRGRGREASESDISREHAIFEDADGLISVAGGKLTTHRAMAEEVVDLVASRLGRRASAHTADVPLGPPPRPLEEFLEIGVDEETALHLQARHDPEAVRRHLHEPRARERIAPSRPHIWAELGIAVHEEMGMTLEDVLVRRLGLFYETSDQGRDVARTVAQRMAEPLGWDASRVDREVQAYVALVADHRRFWEDDGA